jgi:hypothetical protein
MNALYVSVRIVTMTILIICFFNAEKCRQPTPNRLECPRYLDTLKEHLNATFILTLRDPCNQTYNLQIRNKSSSPAVNGSLLDKTFQNTTQVKMQLKGYDKDTDKFTFQGKATFSQWYLRLNVEEILFNTYRVKVYRCHHDITYKICFLWNKKRFLKYAVKKLVVYSYSWRLETHQCWQQIKLVWNVFFRNVFNPWFSNLAFSRNASNWINWKFSYHGRRLYHEMFLSR